MTVGLEDASLAARASMSPGGASRPTSPRTGAVIASRASVADLESVLGLEHVFSTQGVIRHVRLPACDHLQETARGRKPASVARSSVGHGHGHGILARPPRPCRPLSTIMIAASPVQASRGALFPALLGAAANYCQSQGLAASIPRSVVGARRWYCMLERS
jgi:hypothetical protein